MHETPAIYNANQPRCYPTDNLAGFRWHTGATLRPLEPDEACPVLFRDIGPAALATFLRGRLPRLAGPLAPLVYLRTAAYVEPYTDHERTGRLVVLRPLLSHPWHAGTPHVYVARARPGVDAATVGFVPGDVPLADAARRSRELTDVRQWRETLGGRAYDDAVGDSMAALDRLNRELAETEELAMPLRRALQSAEPGRRARAHEQMQRVGLTEMDLCTAWHHLPRARRGFIAVALRSLDVGGVLT
jgi:hypothetical protein